MDRLTFEQLDAAADELDALAAVSPLPDRYCSSTAWIRPARDAFHEGSAPLILRGEHGWAPLQIEPVHRLGATASPLEASWGLASPLVGEDLMALGAETIDALAAHDDWQSLYLPGLAEQGPALQGLARAALERGWRVGVGTRESGRMVASIGEGLDAYLSRRSARFRKNARRERRRSPLTMVDVDDWPADDADALYARVQAIERRSWKGKAMRGIESGNMYTFYREAFPRLLRRGALRLTFARTADGEDAGYIFGGLLGDTYRGLQLSYDAAQQPWGVGNLMQLHTIERLSAEGIRVYDLGMSMGYKRRWCDREVMTISLVVRR